MYKNQFNLVHDRVIEIKSIIVHTFLTGDVEDPDLWAAEPMCQWEQSEQGQWVMKHAIEPPTWHRIIDHASFGHRYIIKAKLTDKDYTFWTLKWANNG